MTVAIAVLLAVTTPAPTTPSPVFDPAARAGEAMIAIEAFVHDVEVHNVELAVATLLDQTAAYVASVTPVPPPPAPLSRSVAPPSTAGTAGGGGLSQTQLDRLAQCENGGQNGWRTGYFGIEAGYPIGNLSYGEQAAWAQRIYAAHGASAWGCGGVL